VTSMLYHHHGLGEAFTNYGMYFDGHVDGDALAYLALANKVIHEVKPGAMTIAEDVSGMPGLGAEVKDGGCGFDYRLAMGAPDFWFKVVKDLKDEDWNVEVIWHELTNRRQDEQVISYVESHDQAIVGVKSFIFELVDAAMYDSMHVGAVSLQVDRGLALWKLARLVTLVTAPHGYLSFIGNEFGHPEWVDFPREGNEWSHHYARRQWSLRDNRELKYSQLGDFDAAVMALVGESEIFESVAELIRTHVSDQVMAFRRGELFFVFNFSPGNSYADYPVGLPEGEYELVLNSDASEFAGHGRLEAGQVYPAPMFYLPTRTALILKKKRSSK
jgi:1,4-alpha-glucan branching enzyme